MINEETRRKLREINLGEAIKGLEVQQADPATIALPFDERMQRLVDYIYQEKYNGKIQRLIKSAKLRFPQANRQGVIYASRGLNRELIENLFSGQYIGVCTRASSSRDLPVQGRPTWPVPWEKKPA